MGCDVFISMRVCLNPALFSSSVQDSQKREVRGLKGSKWMGDSSLKRLHVIALGHNPVHTSLVVSPAELSGTSPSGATHCTCHGQGKGGFSLRLPTLGTFYSSSISFSCPKQLIFFMFFSFSCCSDDILKIFIFLPSPSPFNCRLVKL